VTFVSTDRNATVQRYKECVRVSDKAVSIYMWVGHRGVDLSQFPENRRSLKVKDSETLKNSEGVLSYGHVYQFSFYIITISTADPMTICGPLTGNITTTRSEAIPMVAEICVRNVAQ
jgi:hypothetical protein